MKGSNFHSSWCLQLAGGSRETQPSQVRGISHKIEPRLQCQGCFRLGTFEVCPMQAAIHPIAVAAL